MSMASPDVPRSAQSMTVIVTGASRGIGKEIASLFAQAGYR